MKAILALTMTLGCLLPAVAAAGDDAARDFLPQQLGLSNVVALALAHNPGWQETAYRVGEQEGRLKEVRAARYPRLDVAGSYDTLDQGRLQSFGPDFAPENSRWTAGAEAGITVFSGGRFRYAVRAEDGRLASDRASRDAYRQDLVARTHEVYYDAQLARQQARVQQQAIDVLAEQLKLAERRLDAGSGEPFDVTQARVAAANARPPLIRAENAYRRAIDTLSHLVGLPLPPEGDADAVQVDPQGDVHAVDDELAAALREAVRQRPELAAIAASVSAGEADVEADRRANRPVVDLYAGYGAESDQFGGEDLLEGWVAGVRVNWSVFDGGLVGGRRQQAAARLAQLEERGRELTLRVESEVRQASYDYREARAILETTSLAIGQAEESLRLARNRYEAGKGTQLNVLESQLQLTRARLENSTARRDVQLASIRIKRAIGREL